MPERCASSNPRILDRQLVGKLILGVKPKLQWDASYKLVDNSQSNFPKNSQVLEFFRTPLTPEEVWHRLPPELQNSEDFANTLKKSIALRLLKEDFQLPEFDRPIFILSAPRAGSTLLFETLSQFPDIWTIGRESHDIICLLYTSPSPRDP